MFGILVRFAAAVVVIAICHLNISLYYKPEIKTIEGGQINHDILLQLRHLKQEIDIGAASDMQQIYPEGFVFLHALYALAWCDFLDDVNSQSLLFREGFNEVRKSCEHILSGEGRSPFSRYQPLEYGAFYKGWSTYVLGRKLRLSKYDTAGTYYIKQGCKQIAEYIQTSSTPYASSYRDLAWPADMVLCVAALGLHDQLYKKEYSRSVKHWLSEVRMRPDDHGLLPHVVDVHTGSPTETARGSSQSLMLIFLCDIDRAFAQEQFQRYERLFVTTRFGLTAIHEYPKGEWGLGDIDSGPVLLGIGGASSIVGMRTLATFGKNEQAIEVRNAIEAFGFSHRGDGSKSYLFGTLPIADAFITWAQAGIKSTSVKPSFVVFHLYCSLVIGVIVVLLFKPWRSFARNKKGPE